MPSRFLTAVAAVVLLAAPAVAAPPKPTLVIQVQPVNRVVADVKELMRLTAGPKEGERAAKEFQKELEGVLGEKGFEGIDVNRPVAGYAVVPETFGESRLVLLVPVSTEKEFLGLLDRIGFKAAPVDGMKGVHKIDLPEDVFARPSFLRFAAGGWAYIEFNAEKPSPAADLVPPAELLDPTETALAVARLYPDRFPGKLLAGGLDEFDNTLNGLKGLAAGAAAPAQAKAMGKMADEVAKLVRRYGEGLHKHAASVTIKYILDPATGESANEFVITPKPGSAWATEFAARKPGTNRFAGVIPADAAAGAVLQAPAFAPELREIAAAMFELAADDNPDVPEPFQPVVRELLLGMGRTMKAGNAEAAVALLGPGKAGHFTIVGAVAFDDTAAMEKALRDGLKNPAGINIVSFDAAKEGGVSIHKVALGELLGAEAVKVFGKDATLYFAFAKDAVYAGFGPAADALAGIKRAITAKPGPAPALAVTGNMKRVQALVAAAGGDAAGKEFAAVMGAADKSVNLVVVSVEGGKELRVRISQDMRLSAAVFLLGTSAEGDFGTVPKK